MLWVQVHTDEGLTGLGETFYGPAGRGGAHPPEHRAVPDRQGPAQHRAHQAHLTGYIGFAGASAEMRGRSAIDIALWDILGQSRRPAAVRSAGRAGCGMIKVYNTCAGYSYVQTRPTQGTDNFGLDATKGHYEDLHALPEPRR